MKKIYFTALAVCLLTFACPRASMAADKELPVKMSLGLGEDPANGFYPSFNGLVGLSETASLTFYGTYWTQGAMAWNSNGEDMLMELGCGLLWQFFDGKFTVQPQLGISFGNYQSGGGRAVIGDNIVPALNLSYNDGPLSVNLSLSLWKHLRKESTNQKYIDLMEYSTNPSYAVSKLFTFGLYFDHMFKRTIASKDDGAVKEGDSRTYTAYMWIGPSVRFTAKSGASVWFSAGLDLKDIQNNLADKSVKDFYKLHLSFAI